MRNLFLFLARFRALMLFIILEVVALSIVSRSHLYHHAAFINSTNKLVGTVQSYRSQTTDYFNLGEENRKLSNENARLRSMLKYTAVYPTVDSLLPDTSNKYIYTYLTAKVVNNSLTRFNNFITLDKGSKEGIFPLMGVIDSRGVVGVVSDVSENFSLVQSAVNVNSYISVLHKKTGAFGTLTWFGKSPFLLDVIDMSKSANVKKDDTIITSGYSTFFPPGHPVGVVKSVNSRLGSGFLEIKVRPTNNFNKLNYVYLVNLNKRKEIDTIESRSIIQVSSTR